MSWWEAAENRALRARAPAALAQTLLQRLEAVGLGGEGALAPCYYLGQAYFAAMDLVQICEGVLLAADGDRAALRRQALLLAQWARHALALSEQSQGPLAALLDRLDPDDRRTAAELAQATARAHAGGPGAPPAAEAKQAGRFQRWHLLYERLDIKLAAAGLPASLSRGLARELAETYADLLNLFDHTHALAGDAAARRREVVHFLLDAHAALHFGLPHHLGVYRPAGAPPAALGLQGWLTLLLVETAGEGSIFNVSP